MSLAAEAVALKQALETYGKQIDLEIAAGEEAKVSGPALHIADAFKHDHALTVRLNRRNLLDFQQISSMGMCYFEGGSSVRSSVTDQYYSMLRFTYLNGTIMANRGQPITFSVKQIPGDTTVSIAIFGTRQSGGTYQEFNSNLGVRSVTGTIAEDFTKITYIELRFNRKAVKHTSAYTFENFQLEFGSAATAYTPYLTGDTRITVSSRGKNLFDVSKYYGTAFYNEEGFFKNKDQARAEYVGIDISDIWDIAYALGKPITISFDIKADIDGRVQIYSLGQKGLTPGKNLSVTTEWQRVSHRATPIIDSGEPNGDVCTLSFYGQYGSGVVPCVRNIQIELGDEATELEAFAGATVETGPSGIVKTLTTTDRTTLTTDNDGVYLEAVYQKERIYTSADVVSCTPSFEGGLLTSVMQQAEIEFTGYGQDFADAMKGKAIEITLVAKGEATGTKEFDKFTVKDAEYKDETGSVVLTCYDDMLKAMTPYAPVVAFQKEGGEQVTLGKYLQAICDVLGIKLATPTFTNSSVVVDEEKYNDEYTYRDVLTEIAQAAAGTIAIKKGELYVLYPTATEKVVEPSNLKSITIGEKFGPVNSVVLARMPQEDNIYRKEEAAEKVCEIKIADNQIMDSHREDFVDGIYDALYGLTYYPHDIESFGIGILDICDLFTIKTLDGSSYTALHLSGEMEITQGLVERTKGAAPEATETDYKAASESDRRLNKTILRVDKQENEIQALATETTNAKNELTGQMEAITRAVEGKITPEQVQLLISETVGGIDSITTATGYTFDKDGLRIHKSGDEIENLLDNTGMYVKRGADDVLTANAGGVQAINLTARQYLIVGENSRFEDYDGNRTACFFIGG